MERRRFLAAAAAAGGLLGVSAARPEGETVPPARKISRVDVFPVLDPFRREFRTSAGLIGSPTVPGPHVYLRIVADDGTAGWGEGRPARTWSYETLETVVSTCRRYLGPALLGRDPLDISGAWRILDHEIAPGPCRVGQPVAKAALDIALWDLKAKLIGANAATLWGKAAGGKQKLSFTVCSSEPDGIRAEVEEALAAGYGNFNCKVGRALEDDRREIEALRKCAPDGAFLWADANRGYDLAGALEIIPILRDLAFGALEQPVPDHHGHDLAAIRKAAGPVRILVDEALGHVDDLRNFIRQEAISGITLKLGRMGGITPNMEAARIARDAGLDVLVSGLTESGVALVAAGAIGVAFGGPFPAALNGPQLLGQSFLRGGWPVEEGCVVVPTGDGLGVDVDEEALRRHAAGI